MRTAQEDAKFSVQVNFPDEEEYERRRRAASDQINRALGGAKNQDQKLAMALKKSNLNDDDEDPLTLEERAEIAEERFKAIQDKI